MNDYRKKNTTNSVLRKTHRFTITKTGFLWKFSCSLQKSYEEPNYTPRTKAVLLNIQFLTQGACSDHWAKKLRLINWYKLKKMFKYEQTGIETNQHQVLQYKVLQTKYRIQMTCLRSHKRCGDCIKNQL